MGKRFLVVISLLLGCVVSAQAVAVANPLTPAVSRLDAPSNIQFLRDPAHSLSIDKLAGSSADWEELDGSNINFLYDDSTYWFRFPLHHRRSEQSHWVMDIDWPFLDWVSLYLYDASGRQVYAHTTGDQSPEFQQGNVYRLPHFEFSLAPETDYTVYLRVKTTSSVIVPIMITERQRYQKAEQSLQAIYGLFFGSLLIMALYNAVISIFTRDKSYAFYVAYLLSVTFYALFITGFGQRYLWGASPWIIDQGLSFSVALSFFFGAFFVDHFLKLKQRNAVAHRAVRVYQVIYGVLGIASISAPEGIIVPIEQPLGLLACFVVLAVVGHEIRQGNKVARYFLVAWMALLFGTCAYTLLLVGLIPRNLFTENIQMIGIWIEMLLLSLVLADRINRSRIERLATMQALFETSKEKYEAEAEAKARGEFFAKMSHEIRTPIGGVIGIAELLKDTPLSKAQKKYVQTIANSGESLLAIVSDILDFSKMDAGKLELESIPFNLSQLVNECIDIVSVRADQQRVRFIARIDKAAPDRLVGDPVRLRQILLNLLSNAIKFTEAGEICLRVDVLDSRNGEAPELEFSVTDSGIGLTRDEIGKLFQPFQQADASTTRRFGGTGLGLAICKELVELMGGMIGVRSEPGQGACFWFRVTLPSAYPEKTSQRPEDGSGTLVGVRVLVAEDNPVNAMVLKGLLARLGIESHFVVNGREAVAYFKEHHQDIDAIFMDCEMPEMDGYTASRLIRDWERQRGMAPVPVIALTAHSLGDFMDRCQTSGMDMYLMKPANETALREKLQALLDNKTRHAANG
ncbi:MAG: 7TM diverse intracellular signaling domain-containing protein [Ketobacteraceae bacterium]|nr:7TM diverse intracellular signaling domain-containing protein [Ketobacteraceae bacterium]